MTTRQTSFFPAPVFAGAVAEAQVRSRDVPLILGYGAGVNSFAAAIAMVNRGIVPDLISFANTGTPENDGGEKPETYAYVEEHFRPWLKRRGLHDLTVVHKDSPHVGDLSLEEECLRRETLPSRAFGLSGCAMRWKIEPQEKFLNHWPPAVAAWKAGKKPIKALGYDGDETGRAADLGEDAKLRYWYPLIEWDIDREECAELIRREGLPVPPKSACFYCPSSTKAEVLWLRDVHPDLFERAVALEQRALTSKRHTLVSIRGLGRQWSWKELADATPAEREKMPEAPVEACTTCDDGGCEIPLSGGTGKASTPGSGT